MGAPVGVTVAGGNVGSRVLDGEFIIGAADGPGIGRTVGARVGGVGNISRDAIPLSTEVW